MKNKTPLLITLGLAIITIVLLESYTVKKEVK